MKGISICETCGKEFKWRRSRNQIFPKFCGRICKDIKHHKSYESLSQIFELNTKMNGECLEWVGALSQNGYGKTTYKRKTYASHRLAYELYHGDIEKQKVIRHLCHNKKCVRKEHLLIGTHKDNMQDMVNANRQAKGDRNFAHANKEKMKRGSQVGTSKLNEEQARVIYEMLKSGKTCKIIAKEFNVHEDTISRIKMRKTWAHVEVNI